MSRLPEPDKPQFAKFSERRSELVICSRVEHWVSHWDVEKGRSRKCAGLECSLCAVGVPRVTRFIVMAIDSRGHEVLVELRERHRHILEQIEATVTNGEGVRITARKEGQARNSPVTFTILGPEAVYRREISKLVDCFGLPPLITKIFGRSEAEEHQPESLNVSDQPLQRKVP